MRTIWLGVLGALACSGPALSETWNTYSRSANNAFMADTDSLAQTDDVTSVRVAMVPLQAEKGDLSHSLETFEFQCRQGRWRPAGVVEIGPDGAEADRIPEEGAEWQAVRQGTVPAYLKDLVCDGARSDPTWPSVQAFIEAGRP